MADLAALLAKLQQAAAAEQGAKSALEEALTAERRTCAQLRAELETERAARRRAEAQARSSAAALQRLRALHPETGGADEADAGDGGVVDAALGPSWSPPPAPADEFGSPDDAHFQDSLTQLPARPSAERDEHAAGGPAAAPPPVAEPPKRRIVPEPIVRPAAAAPPPPAAADSPTTRAAKAADAEDDKELPPYGEDSDDFSDTTDDDEEADGAEAPDDEEEEDEEEYAEDEDEEVDLAGTTSGEGESDEEAAMADAVEPGAGGPPRLSRAQRERLEDEEYARKRRADAAAAGQTSGFAELLAAGAALGGGAKAGAKAAGQRASGGAGAASGGDDDALGALAAAAGAGTPAASLTALVEAEAAALQAMVERRDLPKLERRAASVWHQRERFAAEWRNEEAHFAKRLADIVQKLVEAAPPNETPAALRRRCAALEPTVESLVKVRFQLRIAQLEEEPPRATQQPRQPRQPRAEHAAADGKAADSDDESEEEGEDEYDDDDGFLDDGDVDMDAGVAAPAAGADDNRTQVLVMHGARAPPAPKRPSAAAKARATAAPPDGGDADMLGDDEAHAPLPADDVDMVPGFEAGDDEFDGADAPLPLPAALSRPYHAPRSAVEVRRALAAGDSAAWAWECAEVAPSAGPLTEAGQPALLVRYPGGGGARSVEAASRVRPAAPGGPASHKKGAQLELLTPDGWRRAVVAQPATRRFPGAVIVLAQRAELLAAAEALRAAGAAPAGRGALALEALCAARAANPLPPPPKTEKPQLPPQVAPARVVQSGDRAACYLLSADGCSATGPHGTSSFEAVARLAARRAQRWDDDAAAWSNEPRAEFAAQSAAWRALSERRDLRVRDGCVKPLLRGGGAGVADALGQLQRRMARAPTAAWDKTLATLQRGVKHAGDDTPPALRAKFRLPPPPPDRPDDDGNLWALNLRSPRGGGAAKSAAAGGAGGAPRQPPRARRSIAYLPPVPLFGPTDEGGPAPGEAPVMVLGSLAAALKSHQWKGVRFMWSNLVTNYAADGGGGGEQPGCVLAHSMGLGKTLQVLTLLHALHGREAGTRTLLLVPKNVLVNWYDEFCKWLPPGTPGLNASHVALLGLRNPKLENRAEVVAAWHAGDARPEGAVLMMSPPLFATLTASHDPAAEANKKGKGGKKKKLAAAQQAAAAAAATAADDAVDVDPIAPTAAAAGPGSGPAPKSAAEVEAAKRLAAMLRTTADVVVVDEAHELRNSAGVRSQALCSISTQRRLALTGSPLQNDLLEFWTMMEFVRPSDMGTERAFQREFVEPIDAGRRPDATPEERKKMLRKLSVLHDMTDAYVQRVGPELLCSELPPKQEKVVRIRPSLLQHAMRMRYFRYCEASGITATFQRDAYECIITDKPDVVREQALAVEAALRASGERGAAAAAAEASKRILAESQMEDDQAAPPEAAAAAGGEADAAAQVKSAEKATQMLLEQLAIIRASGIADDEPIPCGKLWAVVELARWCTAHNERLLIFSMSTGTLDRIEAQLRTHLRWAAGKHWLRIDGNTKSDQRLRLIKAFNAAGPGEPPHAFLLSTRAGGVGTNMTAATHAICVDTAWNPTHTSQAIARFYRFGQTKKTFAYRLVMDGWREDRVYRKAAQKEELSLRVVDKKSMDYEQQGDAADTACHGDDVPPPRLPDAAALAAWAAGRGDAALEALLAADTARAAIDAAAAPAREPSCFGPWLIGLAEHEDVLKVNVALKLSAADRFQAASDWLQEERAALAMKTATAAAAAAVAGGAPGAAAPRLSARAQRMADRARKRLIDEQLAELPEADREAVLARVAAGEDAAAVLQELEAAERPATQQVGTQALESQRGASQPQPAQEPEADAEFAEAYAAPEASPVASPAPVRAPSQATPPARCVVASPPAPPPAASPVASPPSQRAPSQRAPSQPLPSQRAPSQPLPLQRAPSQPLPSQRAPLHPAAPVVGWGVNLAGAAAASPPEKQGNANANKYVGYSVSGLGGMRGTVLRFANGFYDVCVGRGRVEKVSPLELGDMSPKPAESDPDAEAARPGKRPRPAEPDAERNARPRSAEPDDDVIELD